MFDSRQHNPGTHQGCCITAVGNRFDSRGNFKAAEIGATKNVARVRRSRHEADVNRDGSVESYSVSFDGTA